MNPYRKPDWSNPLEWIIHPVGCIIMIPGLIGYHLTKAALVWWWNVRNSSSLHGAWRPEGDES